MMCAGGLPCSGGCPDLPQNSSLGGEPSIFYVDCFGTDFTPFRKNMFHLRERKHQLYSQCGSILMYLDTAEQCTG